MSNSIRSIQVNIGNACNVSNVKYDIKIGAGLLETIGADLLALGFKGKAVIIADSNVAKLYLKTCEESLIASGFNVSIVTFPAGESSKNLTSFGTILETMAEASVTRSDFVIALGGGVTGDLAGFVAGCYMRGIKFIQVPTTLLAAVDSSVGGKTAVDLKVGKNLVGLFHQPSLVLCDINCLETLPEQELLCGLAEAFKTGVLAGEKLFRLFETDALAAQALNRGHDRKHDREQERENLKEIIAQCVEYKAGVVQRDEREKGERKLLNLGHTIGHAIEKCSEFKIAHGLAIAAGLAIITRASAKFGWCSSETSRRIQSALIKNNLPVTTSYSVQELANAAKSDKKRSGDTITLTIPSEIGACTLREIPVSELENIIAGGEPSDPSKTVDSGGQV